MAAVADCYFILCFLVFLVYFLLFVLYCQYQCKRLPENTRLQNDHNCVERDVKLYSITHSLTSLLLLIVVIVVLVVVDDNVVQVVR